MRKITFGMRGHDYEIKNDINGLAEKMVATGIHTVQLALPFSFPEWPTDSANLNPGFAQEIKTTFAKYDLSIGILSCYINMIHPDLAIREKLLQKFEAYVQFAHQVGAPIVASETGCVLPEIQYTEENFTEEAFQEMAQSVKRLVKAGETFGVTIGIEAGINHPLHNLEKIKRLLEMIDSPYLGIILDATNLITVDTAENQVELVQQAFQVFGEKIVAIHLKDYTLQDKKVIPTNMGYGQIDYQAILDIVEYNKPFCYVIMEETKEPFVKEALKLVE